MTGVHMLQYLSKVKRQAIVQRTLRAMGLLPLEKAEEVSRFAEFLMKQYEEHQLTQGIQQLAESGSVYSFLEQEEDMYTEDDLLEQYDAEE